MKHTQIYPKPFFEIQLLFAQKIAQLSSQLLQDAILHYTALYRIFGLSWSFDPTDSIWQAYLQGLLPDGTNTDWTYQFYLSRYDNIPKFTDFPHWGCFSYDYAADTCTIHIHFSNQDTSEYGALSRHRMGIRIAELRTMFTHIKQIYPDAALVRGGSWLYNRESYKRLFPPAFGQSAHIVQPNFQARSHWGQFLRHDWRVNEETKSQFLQRLNQLRYVQQCAAYFP